MKLRKVMRVIIALLIAGLGFYLIFQLAKTNLISSALMDYSIDKYWAYAVVTLVFGSIGFLIAPAIMRFAAASISWIEARLVKMTIIEVISGAIGLFLGVLLAFLFNMAYAEITIVGPIVSVLVNLICGYVGGYVGLVIGAKRKEDLAGLVGRRKEKQEKTDKEKGKADKKGESEVVAVSAKLYKILDTSVIIDGRIADIIDTGFLDGTLLVPEFVLDELQRIADSSDMLKRNRGRRGLDILNQISKKEGSEIEISSQDFDDVTEVDSKLVRLAQSIKMPILTNDYNLNKIAELHGVKVLNINELANMVKPVVLPGEGMTVQVLKEGKEAGQGVAYLEDGTMVVVDGGRNLIGQEAQVTVTTVLQTAAGRMIFVKPKDDLDDPSEYYEARMSY
ncbi:MAG: TRAM domain-containing protein [Peptococcaceae bacterium]|nr:TRAM domain-containing protein [Peptococcaceae bacterium]